jgi:hypothetical protein
MGKQLHSFTIQKLWLMSTAAAALLFLLTLSPVAAQPGPNPAAEADKLHVVLLVAGADSSIGNADLKDVAAMRQAVAVSFAAEPKRVVLHDLTGKNPTTRRFYTGPEILKHVREMKVGPNDNVLIFHSGHGGINDRKRPEESHVLVVDGGQVGRMDLTKAVLSLKPRGLILLTDCCSTFAKSALAQDAPRVNTKTVRNLLLKSTGVVSITAAEDGTMAQAGYKGANPGRAGSAFTVALMRLWYRQDVTFTTWKQFFPRLRQETGSASGGQHRARAFHLGEPAPAR